MSKLKYALRGFAARAGRKSSCPSCQFTKSEEVASKGPYQLLLCGNCALLYRWPNSDYSVDYYQQSYRHPGLTTDLPSKIELYNLMRSNFKRSEKDFSRYVALLEAAHLYPRLKVLDFGANWGYGVYQFKEHGYTSVGYEVSVPRAQYSQNLGVSVLSDWNDVVRGGPYDVIFSAHVLEHILDPLSALRAMQKIVRPGGAIVAVFPNGSKAFRHKDFSRFNKLWGQVHPVLLSDQFCKRNLQGGALAMGVISAEDLSALEAWDCKAELRGDLDQSEMFAVWRSPRAHGRQVDFK